MDHFAGLDVSVKETSICIVDDTGRIVRAVKAASELEALLQVLGNPTPLPLQADRTRSRTSIAMAFQRACRSRLAGDLCRDIQAGSRASERHRSRSACSGRQPHPAGRV